MEDFVSFDIAKKLKEKGFNEPCFGWYYATPTCQFNHKLNIVFNHSELRGVTYDDLLLPSHGDNINAPTISQVLKWLRKEKKIYVGVTYIPKIDGGLDFFYSYIQYIGDYQKTIYPNGNDNFDSWEGAALNGIEYVLDNLIK